MILTAKCAPEERILTDIVKADIKAVELYLSKDILEDVPGIIKTCKQFPLRYTVHAPNDGTGLSETYDLVALLKPEAAVLHNIYWLDEWEGIVKAFQKYAVPIYIENTIGANEIVKFVQRFDIGFCFDLEHAQMECCGFYEEAFIPILKRAGYFHLTGYTFGSNMWHTPIHHTPEHNRYLLGLLKQIGYSGFIVSEASVGYQTCEEFAAAKEFFDKCMVNG